MKNAKPSSSQESPRAKGLGDPELDRKYFLTLMSMGLGSLIMGVLGGSGLGYFISPAFKKRVEEWQEVTAASELPEGKPVKLDYVSRRADGWTVSEGRSSVWLLKEKGEIIAFDPKCTHLGCPYSWNEAKETFDCPCHTAVFAKTGEVISGPPPHPLDRFAVKVDRGIVSILPGGSAKS